MQQHAVYTQYEGLKIPVNLYIVWPFSQQIVNRNSGPASALESMGGKR